MNCWFVLTALGAACLAQMHLAAVQMKDFSSSYGALRRRGRVAIGKRKNAFSAGAIAMLLLDGDGTVIDARAMSGLTVMARFKPLDGVTGRRIDDFDPAALRRCPRGLRLAVANAQENWATARNGGVPEDPPGPLGRLLERLPGRAGTGRARRRAGSPGRPATTATARRRVVRSTPPTRLEGVIS